MEWLIGIGITLLLANIGAFWAVLNKIDATRLEVFTVRTNDLKHIEAALTEIRDKIFILAKDK